MKEKLLDLIELLKRTPDEVVVVDILESNGNDDDWEMFIRNVLDDSIILSQKEFDINLSFPHARSLKSKARGTSIMPIILIDVRHQHVFRIDIIHCNETKSFIIGRV